MIDKIEEILDFFNDQAVQDGEPPLVFVREGIEAVLKQKKFKDVFFIDKDDVLVIPENEEFFYQFCMEVKNISVQYIMTELVERGDMESGVNGDGEIVYKATDKLIKKLEEGGDFKWL